MRCARAAQGLAVGRNAGQLERAVGFHRGADVGRAAGVNIEAAIGQLAFQDGAGGLLDARPRWADSRRCRRAGAGKVAAGCSRIRAWRRRSARRTRNPRAPAGKAGLPRSAEARRRSARAVARAACSAWRCGAAARVPSILTTSRTLHGNNVHWKYGLATGRRRGARARLAAGKRDRHAGLLPAFLERAGERLQPEIQPRAGGFL